MKKITLFLLLACFASALLTAQTGISFGNAEKYDPDRYKEYKGSPYFFSDFTDGWIIDTDDVMYDKVKMNYNGHTDMFEVLQGNLFINLQEAPYKSITLLDPETQDTVTFIRGVHADFRGKYIQLLYESEKVTLVNKFRIYLVKSDTQTLPGGVEAIKKFRPENDYYLKLKDDPDLYLLKSNKKSWVQVFGNKKLIETYIKKNKLNLSKEPDILKLLTYAENL